jgi:hypothetical protein
MLARNKHSSLLLRKQVLWHLDLVVALFRTLLSCTASTADLNGQLLAAWVKVKKLFFLSLNKLGCLLALALYF